MGVFTRIEKVQGCPSHRAHVVLGFVSPLGARSAREDVLFERGQFGFVLDHAQVIPLKVVIGDVLPFRSVTITFHSMVFPGFTTFRLSLPTRQRDALDTLASKLLAISRTKPGYPPKDFWWRWIQQAYPRFSADQCKMMANYAIIIASSGIIGKAAGGGQSASLGNLSNQIRDLQLQNISNQLGDLSTQQQLALQQAMSQKNIFEQTFSNMLKTWSDAASGIICNLK